MSFRLKTHVDDNNGEGFESDELFDEFLPAKKLKQSLVCSDMDGTMFDKDIGIMVFLEQLSRRGFWARFPRDSFRDFLLPRQYSKLIKAGARGREKGLPVKKCRTILHLCCSIARSIRFVRRPAGRRKDVNYSRNIAQITRFAAEMFKLDQLLMELDAPCLSKRFSGNLLMRTRFFAGMKPYNIRRWTRLALGKGGIPLAHGPQQEEDIPLSLKYDSRIEIISEVRDMLKKCFDKGAEVKVITANLTDIGKAAVDSTDYRFLSPEDVAGTTLQQVRLRRKMPAVKEDKFRGFLGRTIYGGGKLELVQRMEKARKKLLIAAFGDSPMGDGAMGRWALSRGGVFVAVGNDYKDTREKFESLYKRAKADGVPRAGEKIWYVEHKPSCK